MEKNVYAEYRTSAQPRSPGEKLFERHPELKMGFVRYDKKSLQLRIATREYSEDLDDVDHFGPKWVLLKEVL